MKASHFSTIYLKDYRPPAFQLSEVHLEFDLHETATTVLMTGAFRKADPTANDLTLVGRDIPTLLGVTLDGRTLVAGQDYEASPEALVIKNVPAKFSLSVKTEINPKANTALEGLYYTGGKFCTQCEAEGFRRMVYFLDRPDVMAVYTTKIIADKERYPLLLAGGNPTAAGDLADGRHYAEWQDPHPKPSYLFALVAGDLAVIEDEFVTASGAKVALRIYVEEVNRNRCDFAMQAIKDSMRWDEERFGLEYDLGIFMVVAVSDFNMGAMENKGLNVFNAKYVLADAETATDDDFYNIQSVVGHEYFHNWTGNRVTCRDWFQLSLKEGLTVYRDQEFSAAMTSPHTVRIREVADLKRVQFPEDKSPMAHPVRPQSYIEIGNFYTATVYNKGAEVIRMMATMLGRDGFRKGMDLYFARHDGQAVTTEDFVAAMADANSVDLEQFKLWYDQAGTPQVTWQATYEAPSRRLFLDISQQIPDTPGQTQKKPHVLPMTTGLIGPEGEAMTFTYNGATAHEHVILVTEARQRVVLENVKNPPIVSCFRGFSAPVNVWAPQNLATVLFLMRHDPDPYNRFEATQRAAREEVVRLAQNAGAEVDPEYVAAFRAVLNAEDLEPLIKSQCLQLPAMDTLLDGTPGVKLEELYRARRQLAATLAAELADDLQQTYERFHDQGAFAMTKEAVAHRALKNRALFLLAPQASPASRRLVYQQFQDSRNMTDTMAALTLLMDGEAAERGQALAAFYERWHTNPLVMDKWFAVQSSSWHPDALAHTKALVAHQDYDAFNPNRVFAVVRNFCHAHPEGFHKPSGAGYDFVADQVIAIDKHNASVAARLVIPISRWYPLDPARQALMKQALQKIAATPGLSKDVFEIVDKALQA